MDIREKLSEMIKSVAERKGFDTTGVSVSFSNRPDLCDFQSSYALALAKKINKKPIELAQELVEELNKNKGEDILFSVAIPGFINISLGTKELSKYATDCLNDKLCGVEKVKTPRKLLLDYGGANVAKQLHVGHLRSPIIGEALKRLHKLLGDNVLSDTHLGDYGLQMGLTILQLKEDGYLDKFFAENANLKTLQLENVTLDTLNEEYPKASTRKNNDEAFKKIADDITLFIQQKKEPYFAVYNKIKELSIEDIKKNYALLNAWFDYWYGESDAQDYVDETVQMFIDKGLARESEGALVVDIAREGEHIPIPKKSPDEVQRYKNPMPPAVIKKYNGADLYVTTDLATILMRNKTDKLDEIVYITDNRQGNHFEQVFRCAKLAGISPEGQTLKHIAFGTMNGSDGKPFKTRDGGVVRLKEVLQLLIDKAQKKLKENGIENDPELARKIGVGAMKFGDLSNIVTKDYVFDIDKFLSFEGKTGPYIQYTIARINSILNKAEDGNEKIIIETQDEKNIVISLAKLNSAYRVCYEDYSLNLLCSATYDLASAFSTLYNNQKILGEKDKKKRGSLLMICKLVKKALSQALDTLGIDTVEKM